MPTNRTTRKRGRGGAGLSESAKSYFWWNGLIYNEWVKEKSEAEVLKFWQKNRKEILEWFIERNRQNKGEPGKRPEMFWQEITEERRKTGTEKWIGPVRSDGGSREITEDVYESDAQYLDRLGLLTGWEKEQFEAEKGQKRGKKK